MLEKIRKIHDREEKSGTRNSEQCFYHREWLLEVCEDQVTHINELIRHGKRLEKRIAELEQKE